ncbi:hypothetical protein [Latilactobacillus fuchuensis]|uniref:hypothetical protein n=1 Tax=Latilactobacillus fuchuensis TaxID=164393 RepID=UPI0039B0C60E
MTSIIDALLDWIMIHFKGLLILSGVLIIGALIRALYTDWLGAIGFMVFLLMLSWLKEWWRDNR